MPGACVGLRGLAKRSRKREDTERVTGRLQDSFFSLVVALFRNSPKSLGGCVWQEDGVSTPPGYISEVGYLKASNSCQSIYDGCFGRKFYRATYAF